MGLGVEGVPDQLDQTGDWLVRCESLRTKSSLASMCSRSITAVLRTAATFPRSAGESPDVAGVSCQRRRNSIQSIQVAPDAAVSIRCQALVRVWGTVKLWEHTADEIRGMPLDAMALLTGHRLAVTDTRGNALLLFDVSPLRQVGQRSLPGTPYGMAVDHSTNTVWITLTARNEVVGIDTSSTRPR